MIGTYTALNLSHNPKQRLFFNIVTKAEKRQTEHRVFLLEGGIRSGKTTAIIAKMIDIAIRYPNTKHLIVRRTLQDCRSSTVPSFEKYCPPELIDSWTATPELICYLKNGSQFIFMGENYDKDKDLNKFLGMEWNTIFLEQVEELTEFMYSMALQRTGSWDGKGHKTRKKTKSLGATKRRINSKFGSWIEDSEFAAPILIPPPFIFMSCNPTHRKWVKDTRELAYSPECPPHLWAMNMTPLDNYYVTEDQKRAWQNLGSVDFGRMIQGDWDVQNTEGLFAYAFNSSKHVTETLIYDTTEPVYLSFDFNHNPITCTAWQHNDSYIRCIYEFRLENSDIYKLCDRIKEVFPSDVYFYVTGDATGRARQAISRDNITYYDVIQSELMLPRARMRQPSINPGLKKSQTDVNYILEKHPAFSIHKNCKFTIEDLASVKMDENMKIDKSDDALSHLLDTVRYYINSFHADYRRNFGL